MRRCTFRRILHRSLAAPSCIFGGPAEADMREPVVVLWLLGAVILAGIVLGEEDRSQARSMVISRRGIVAAEHPLAAQAGAMVLANGGHAVDAAVAANAVMGLVAPMSNGIGGDLFALVYDARAGKLYGLNASGWAPTGLTVDLLRRRGITKMPDRGILSVTVPGAVEGWSQLLHRFGRKTLAELLAPAIRLADDGFPVTELVRGLWL